MTQPMHKQGTGALNTLSQTLTVDDWQNALDAAKTHRKEAAYGQERRDTNQSRHQTIRRCLLRVDRGESAPGIYIVRSRNISDGGISLIHGGPVKPDSICCIIIETEDGVSTALGGTVVWSNPIPDTDPPAYELGLRFYTPINAEAFVPQLEQNEDAA